MLLLKKNIGLMLSILVMLISTFNSSMAINYDAISDKHNNHLIEHSHHTHQACEGEHQLHCSQLQQAECYFACTIIPYFLHLPSFNHQLITSLALFQPVSIGIVIRRIQSILRPPTW